MALWITTKSIIFVVPTQNTKLLPSTALDYKTFRICLTPPALSVWRLTLNDKWKIAICTAGLHWTPLSCWLCTLLRPWEKEEGRTVAPWAGREPLCIPAGPSVTAGATVPEGIRALEHPVRHPCLSAQPQPTHAGLPDISITYQKTS